MTNTEHWDAIAGELAATTRDDVDRVRYGAGVPDEGELRLLGPVAGKRILDLGCGLGQAAIALVRQGAHVVAVDASERMLAEARRRAETYEVAVEWHRADLADLAFLRADSVDAALAVDSLDEVDDVDRVFRQVHRVLKPGAPLVFTLEHPVHACVERDAPSSPGALPLGRLVVTRDYGDPEPRRVTRHGRLFTTYPRTVAGVFSSLHRAGYRVENILEPRPPGAGDPGPQVPTAILWRARKQGS
jgi:SAM-dependent methyltransferase